MREEMLGIVAAVVMMAFLLIGIYYSKKYTCLNQWEGSGMDSKFGIFQGCLVRTRDGHWIPAKNYREL